MKHTNTTHGTPIFPTRFQRPLAIAALLLILTLAIIAAAADMTKGDNPPICQPTPTSNLYVPTTHTN